MAMPPDASLARTHHRRSGAQLNLVRRPSMYSAWSTSCISGIVVAIVTAGAGAVQLGTSSTPEPLPVSFMVVTSLVVACVVGVVMTFGVRGGLRLASCRQLALPHAPSIPAVSLLLFGILAIWPVETHAIKIDMPSGHTSPLSPPSSFWLFVVVAILIPVLVSYFIGRVARGTQGPPGTSLERTRER